MKTLKLCIPILSLVLLSAACRGPRSAKGITHVPLRDRQDIGLHHAQAQRIDGQRASEEAGLHDEHWIIKQDDNVKAAQTPAKHSSGASTLLPASAPVTPSLQPAAPSPSGDFITVPLACEEFVTGKRTVPAGRVIVRKNVTTENVSQVVPLSSDNYIVERVSAGELKPDAQMFKGSEAYFELFKDEPVSEVRSRIKEIVRVRRTSSVENRTISSPIRCETIEVERRP